jgi:hypothetical protein
MTVKKLITKYAGITESFYCIPQGHKAGDTECFSLTVAEMKTRKDLHKLEPTENSNKFGHYWVLI